MSSIRQQILYLWMQGSSLAEPVVAWAFHDGTDGAGPTLPEPRGPSKPPYRIGVEALRDGWMLLQSAQLVPTPPGMEHINSYFEYEFVFERRIELS